MNYVLSEKAPKHFFGQVPLITRGTLTILTRGGVIERGEALGQKTGGMPVSIPHDHPGHRACVDALFAACARRDLVDGDGMTAAMLARNAERDTDFVAILE